VYVCVVVMQGRGRAEWEVFLEASGDSWVERLASASEHEKSGRQHFKAGQGSQAAQAWRLGLAVLGDDSKKRQLQQQKPQGREARGVGSDGGEDESEASFSVLEMAGALYGNLAAHALQFGSSGSSGGGTHIEVTNGGGGGGDDGISNTVRADGDGGGTSSSSGAASSSDYEACEEFTTAALQALGAAEAVNEEVVLKATMSDELITAELLRRRADSEVAHGAAAYQAPTTVATATGAAAAAATAASRDVSVQSVTTRRYKKKKAKETNSAAAAAAADVSAVLDDSSDVEYISCSWTLPPTPGQRMGALMAARASHVAVLKGRALARRGRSRVVLGKLAGAKKDAKAALLFLGVNDPQVACQVIQMHWLFKRLL
jgi:hypothetical protein